MRRSEVNYKEGGGEGNELLRNRFLGLLCEEK